MRSYFYRSFNSQRHYKYKLKLMRITWKKSCDADDAYTITMKRFLKRSRQFLYPFLPLKTQYFPLQARKLQDFWEDPDLFTTDQLISIDYWQNYDPDEVCETGFALIGSDPEFPLAICFLCGSAGFDQVRFSSCIIDGRQNQPLFLKKAFNEDCLGWKTTLGCNQPHSRLF